ncbi:hypothetical protein GQ457_11G021160 [Hibiscus cannabinus]
MEIADNVGQGISLAGDVRYGLLGKLLSPRLANGNAVVRTFTNIWEEEQAEALPLKHGMFLFKFPGDPLVTIPFDPSLSLNEHDFSKILYWVRIHKLPLNMMTMDIAALVGSRFEKLIVVDTRHNLGNLGEFFRLRVEIAVYNPLLRCVTVGKHADGRTRICPVQFEKLNKFCFNCGRLGHEIDLCPQTRDVNATTTPYWPWMRAPMDTRRPPPYQRKGIVYCEVNTALNTISQQVPSTVTMANPSGGISKKELVELAQIANELGVNSSMFVDPVVVSTEVEACGQKPMQPVLQAGIETGSSSKDNDPSHAGHTNLVIAGVETGTVAADPILHKNKMVLVVDPDPGSLGKMNSLAVSSSILHVQEIEHETPKVVHTDAGPPVSKGDAQLLARLDRFLATHIWLDAFPNHRVQSEYTAASNHFFLLLDTTGASLSNTSVLHNDYYKFEACWASEQECHDRVASCWEATHQTTLEKLYNVGRSLHTWQQRKRFHSVRRINHLQKAVNDMMANPLPSPDDLKTLADSELELKKLLDKEEAYWSQRLRVLWLREDDRNTRFFHARANGRRKKNRILGLSAPDGTWHDRLPGLHRIASDYFTGLFSSSACTSTDVIIDCISPSITDAMNATLRAPFTSEEVQTALFQIHPSKAPGVDGLPSSFYRQFWDTLGADVIQLCLDILHDGVDMSDVNKTVITVSKVLVNRLSLLMSVCIEEEHAAFVPGRHISNNIIVAHEIIHYLLSAKNGPNKGAALKLDIEKAYDRVEWSFLWDVILKLGFDPNWVALIMRCISTVTYQVKINGSLSETIIPSRGIRQGDPLSPYLFLFCTHGLSSMLHAKQNKGLIRGIRASQDGPRVTHLLPATPPASRARFFDILPVKEVSAPDNYLGMPLFIGRNKLQAFGFLSDKVNSRVRGWNKNLLSYGGREVFLKAVAQALPTYVMSCYMLPIASLIGLWVLCATTGGQDVQPDAVGP